MMVRKINRRMRCEVQGCHKLALVGIGAKGLDYPMCEDHFKSLLKEGIDLLKPVNTEVNTVEKPAEEPKKEAEAQTAEVVEAVEEFYECKYCNQKFSKIEMTANQYAQHCKKCKKEHEQHEEK